ncbi:ANTAR domain-containing protein [Pseudonocardia sp. NPDC049154]|uniref:ANTAR domain-containing protein n=1 Tax=Pseudonocardia sp. NPDC049154 TaxID=3155501 RepID=UPI0033E2488B
MRRRSAASSPIEEGQAFELLRRTSQHFDVELRDVATTVIEEGRMPVDTRRPE